MRSKRKKLAVPRELLDVVDETVDDSDTVVCEINEKEFAFMGNADESGDAENVTTKRMHKKKTSAPLADAVGPSPKPTSTPQVESTSERQPVMAEQTDTNPLPPTAAPNEHVTRSDATAVVAGGHTNRETATIGIHESETALIEDVFSDDSVERHPQTNARTATSVNTAIGATTNISTGAIPKTKAAYKQGSTSYELPRVSESWNDQMEREERERRRTLVIPSSSKTIETA